MQYTDYCIYTVLLQYTVLLYILYYMLLWLNDGSRMMIYRVLSCTRAVMMC